MLEKWELREVQDAADPKRHRLFIKAERQDVLGLIREFANLCGRPLSVRTEEGFNWSIDLRSLSRQNKSAVEAFLKSMSAPPKPAPAPALSPALGGEAAPAVSEPSLESAAKAPTDSTDPMTQDSALAPTPQPALETPPDLSAPAPIPEAQELATASPDIAAPADNTPTPIPVPAQAGGGDPVDFARNFDSLVVGPYNRFAHAAATSVVDAPASLYNPLLLFGPPGVGKTHLLNAIAAGLSQSLGPDGIVLISGFKLSCLLDPMGGGQTAFAGEFLEGKMKALIIDDFHLMKITESNKPELARFFAACLSKKCQVVASSLYPPKALAFLEQALGISFGKGWAVDLKVPAAEARLEIFKALALRRSLALNAEEISALSALVGSDYAAAAPGLARLSAFKKIRENFSLSTQASALLPMLFDSVKPAPPDAAALESAKSFVPPEPSPGAAGLAFFSPEGHDGAGAWCLARFYQAAGHYGMSVDYRVLLKQAYGASQGVPFEIGALCRQAGAAAALIVGPGEDSPLFAKAGEFRQVVTHVVRACGVRAAWIARDEIASSAPFLNAHLDIVGQSYE